MVFMDLPARLACLYATDMWTGRLNSVLYDTTYMRFMQFPTVGALKHHIELLQSIGSIVRHYTQCADSITDIIENGVKNLDPFPYGYSYDELTKMLYEYYAILARCDAILERDVDAFLWRNTNLVLKTIDEVISEYAERGTVYHWKIKRVILQR